MNTEYKVASLLEARNLMKKYDMLIAKRDFANDMLANAKIQIRGGGGSAIVETFKRKKSPLGRDELIGEWNAVFEKAVTIWSNELASIEAEIKALEEPK